MPLLKLAYVVGLAVGLFFLRDPRVVGGLAVLQLALWAVSRVDFRLLGRIGRRLAIFLGIVLLVYGLSATRGGGESDFRTFLGLDWNLVGLQTGLVMALRVLTLVLASTWVQKSGAAGDLSRAMIQARMPKRIAWTIDATLALLTAGGGGGGGGGQGKGKEKRGVPLREVLRGEFPFLRDLLVRSIARAQARIRAEHPDLSSELARDVALVSGIALAAMGLKMLQVMPGLPIAPGQKNVMLLPFFLLAAQATRSRFGGLWCGATVGLINFFLGFGKYGIFELAQFLLPGLLADVFVVLLHGRGWWRLAQLILFGLLMGVTRFGANFLNLMLAGGDWKLFAVYTPMLLSQMAFGAASGFVSAFLLRFDDWWRAAEAHEGGGGGRRGSGGGRRRGDDSLQSPDPEPDAGDVKRAS